MSTERPNKRVSAARQDTEARGETFYPGPSRNHLASFPPKERWDDWVELDARAWPQRVEQHSMLVPTTCFNCESACGLLAYVDPETLNIRKFEGNPEHPASRGRNCAKGPATLNQINDPDRILYPLKRAGKRGEGKWQQVSWDEALGDIASRLRRALQEGRRNEIMYHVGRPGEDGYTERVLAAWGVDGHNSHTNICSSGARAGYHFWMGADRPSPDHEHADVILLISAHLESGHYFNPHAQRIMDAKRRGAKLIVFDVRLSNSATHADHWVAPYPGSEAAILLAIANHLIQTEQYNRTFVHDWWNWQEYLQEERPDLEPMFANFETVLKQLYTQYSFAFAAQESGISVQTIEAIATLVASAGTRLATHTWRSASAGNLGGWQVARALFFLNALTGAVATPGGTYPNAWNKFVPRPIHTPPHPPMWNTLSWPAEYPLAIHELSFLLPHFLKEERAKLDVYFTRVYNPVWTNPDGFSWIETLSDEQKIGLHVALTPTWNESAYFADYILPMGVGSERHDTHSYETHDAQWVGFRQPVLRAARERLGQPVTDTRQTNPGAVWEENEFWIELSWQVDPDGALGIRQYFESKAHPGQKLTLDEYYGFIFEQSVPGLPEQAAAQGLSPLAYMRRYGAFEIQKNIGAVHTQTVPPAELDNTQVDHLGRVFTTSPKPAGPNIVPLPSPDGDPDGRRRVGVQLKTQQTQQTQALPVYRGFPTPSGRLEFYSKTLKDWGWPEYALPMYSQSHIHPDRLAADQMVLIPTFRLPVQIHTRSANAKWLDEIAHTNPLWLHPGDAKRLGVGTGDLVRVETEIGYFVLKAWVTEGIRPGVVGCSHHMGRWKLDQAGQRQMMATVGLDRNGSQWRLSRKQGVHGYPSEDADSARVWWTDTGVHQNLTFPVHPDPISGMHCWHQAVRVLPAQKDDQYGDIQVDTDKAHAAYKQWLELTRPASQVSPDGTRRPYWMLRPLKPGREHYQLPETERPPKD